MTGEITLTGEVLPIGGVKEKVLAANRLGIKQILLPEKNKRDLEELPESVKNKLHFVYVKNVDDVLAHALEVKNGSAGPVTGSVPVPMCRK